MDWLQSLLWDPSSVAHIVFLYAFVVAAGVYLHGRYTHPTFHP